MILDIRVIAFSFIVLFGYETDSFTSFSRKVLKFASPTTFMSHDYEGTKSESRVSDMSSLNQVIGNVQLASTHSDPSDVLCMSTNELSQMIGGSGKAKFLWEYLRNGVDPLSLAHSFQENIDSKLSIKAKNRIQEVLGGKPLLSATIESEVLSSCGTRKLLLNLADNLRIESVLIPSFKYKRTTLCVSTQIGYTHKVLLSILRIVGPYNTYSGVIVAAHSVSQARWVWSATSPRVRSSRK